MIRYLYVEDAATEIPVAVIIPARVESTGAAAVLRRAGYGTAADERTVIVTDLNALRTAHSPFDWGDWTMRAFHDLIETSDAVRMHVIHGDDGMRVNVETHRLRLIRERS